MNNRIHPVSTGALYGLIAAVLNVALAYVNQHYAGKNGFLGLIYSVIVPLVAIYLAGHLTGRQERINLQTTVTSGTQSTLFGTGAGVTTGVIYVIVSSILTYILNRIGGSSTLPSSALGVLASIGGLIVWLVVGLLGGTVGGFFGDSRAHKQLKSGQLTAKPAKS